MTQENGNYLFLWEKTAEKEIRLLRVFGESGAVAIPEEISGFTVTEIGNYCFSKQRLPDTDICYTACINQQEKSAVLYEKNTEELLKEFPVLHEISEKYIEQIKLPATVKKIGACAFYNCTKMKKIVLYPGLSEAGSDAFMNCLNLKKIDMLASVEEKTGLKQLLAQIKWQVEVAFYLPPDTLEAQFLFPEYYESYDEIGPAHIFELNLTGEGFRARQCFKDGVFLTAPYDEIFERACVEEPKEVLAAMAWDRLFVKKDLSDEARSNYESYLKDEGKIIVNNFTKERRLAELLFFFREGYGTEELLKEAICAASNEQWTEGTAALLSLKEELSIQSEREKTVKERYSFDDF